MLSKSMNMNPKNKIIRSVPSTGNLALSKSIQGLDLNNKDYMLYILESFESKFIYYSILKRQENHLEKLNS